MSAATPGQADEPEIPVRLVRLWLCELCLDGKGGECHSPGCALFLNRAPDIGIRSSPMVTFLDAAQEPKAAPCDLPVTTPAVTRPTYGDVIILAVREDFPDGRAQELQNMLAELNQGITVTTVRGVEALRTWQPQPAPELAALADELERLAGEHFRKADEYDRDAAQENFHRGCRAALDNAAGRIRQLIASQEGK